MNVHRTTRSTRWQLALALVMVSALAVTAGVALGAPQSQKAVDDHRSDRELRPRGDVRRQQRRQGVRRSRPATRLKVVVASDLGQQLAQGFASGNPPDIFYLGNDQVATYAKAGDLAPLDNLKNVKSFYPSLKAAYTYKGHLYAAPKDFSTLALVINTASWKKARTDDAELPEDVGAARGGREEADAERARSASAPAPSSTGSASS